MAAPERSGRPASANTLDQFSAHAQRVFGMAEDEARLHNHTEIRPEHLMLAMLAAGRAGGAKTIARIGGIEPAVLRQALEQRLGRGDTPVDGPLELSDGCKQVLQLAVADAQRLRHPQVETNHLLIGLVSEGSTLQGEMLTALALRGLRVGALGSRAWGVRSPDAAAMAVAGSPGGRGGGPGATRDNVVTLRVGDEDLAAVDALVELGIARTRSEGAAWLLHAGIGANASLFERAQGIVGEIRRLREEAQQLALEHVAETTDPVATGPVTAEQSAAST